MGKLKLVLSFSFFSLLLLTTFNNCGKVELRSQSSTPSPVVGSSESINYISIPELPEQQLRAVFLVDMSRSMVAGPCSGSADTLIPGVRAVANCNSLSGTDNGGNRFKVLRDWIAQVQAAVTKGVIKDSQVKLMIVPFSGGQQDGHFKALVRNWPAATGFASINDFLSALNRLEGIYIRATAKTDVPVFPPYIPVQDQLGDILKTKGNAMIYMGTSVPSTSLDKINTAVSVELDLLKAANLTRATQFEVVFMSDGVPKPRPDHMAKIIEMIWTIKKTAPLTRYSGICVDPPNWQMGEECFEWRRHENIELGYCINACKAETLAYAETGELPGTRSPACSADCFTQLEDFSFDPNNVGASGNKFTTSARTYWGSWELNTNPKIFFQMATLINVFRRNSDTRYRFSFVRLDSNEKAFELPVIELDPKSNWITKAQQVYPKGHRFATQKDSKTPFSLFMSLKNNERYQVSQVFAINLNARVNSYGALEVDSDADGLPDILETTQGFNVSNPRSDGVCLDSIKYMMSGCINVGCDPAIDIDGDGLNECEERTLGIDTQDFDTDGDGIPDGYEVLFGLNPLSSDRLKTAIDGSTNMTHFQRGAVSDVYLKDIPSERLIHFIANLKDQKMIKDSQGRTINSPGYVFNLKNIPLVNTLKSTDNLVLYRSKIKQPSNVATEKLIGGSHNVIENRILFMIRVDSLDNPGDSFWVKLEQKLKYNPEAKQEIKINYNDFQIMNVMDPLGEIK